MKNIILAIDYGIKFSGLALYHRQNDPYPLPYTRLPYKGDEQLIKEILKLAKQEEVDTLVVGIPRLLDGQETKMSAKIKKFAQHLAQSTSIKTYQQDETLSTYEAKERMKNSPQYNFKVDLRYIDALAACIILEDFLSSH